MPRVVFLECEGALPIAVSNRASKFIGVDELPKIGTSVLNYIRAEEQDAEISFVIVKD